jgi:predicted O-methyltransferase YrrM
MNLAYWLRRPGSVLPRVRYWLWERQNPDKPWLCPGTIDFCEKNLRKPMKGVEFGSGRSTIWFADRLGSLTSVEHAPQWHAQVRKMLSDRGVANVDYRLVALDHPEEQPEAETYASTPKYVAVLDEFADESLDFVLVDGHYRTTCIRHCLGKLKPGGILLVDDVNMWGQPERVPVPRDWPMVDRSTNGVKLSCAWRKPAPGLA